MGRRLAFAVTVLVAVMVLGPAGTARAAEGAGVLLAYGASYSTSTGSRTHHGVDIVPGPDGIAMCPVAGEVTFCGRIPADDGGSTLAMTVLTACGLSVTVHPLAEAWVSEGSLVSDGEGVGLVADTGDGSCSSKHLHLSAREGGVYIDPMFLLVVPNPGSEAPITPKTEASTLVASGDAAIPSGAAATPATVEQPAVVPLGVAAGTPAMTGAAGALPAGVSLAAGVAGDVPSAVMHATAMHALCDAPFGVGEVSGQTPFWRTGKSAGRFSLSVSNPGLLAALAAMGVLVAAGVFRWRVLAHAEVS